MTTTTITTATSNSSSNINTHNKICNCPGNHNNNKKTQHQQPNHQQQQQESVASITPPTTRTATTLTTTTTRRKQEKKERKKESCKADIGIRRGQWQQDQIQPQSQTIIASDKPPLNKVLDYLPLCRGICLYLPVPLPLQKPSAFFVVVSICCL